MVAYQSSLGAVSDFIQRYLHGNVGSNWGQLKTELTSRFATITDLQHAFVLLPKVKQRTDENVQLYAERLLSLAEEAFTGQNGGVAAIERQLEETQRCNDHLVNFCALETAIFPINLSKLGVITLFTQNKENIGRFCRKTVRLDTLLPTAVHLFHNF